MPDDEIMNEIGQCRQEHAAFFEYDVQKIVHDLQRQENKSGRSVLMRSPRKPATVPTLIRRKPSVN